MGNEGEEECLGMGETRHPLESVLSPGIRIPPPCLPPGSSQQLLGWRPPLRSFRSSNSRDTFVSSPELGPAERSCQALLSTSYQTGERD